MWSLVNLGSLHLLLGLLHYFLTIFLISSFSPLCTVIILKCRFDRKAALLKILDGFLTIYLTKSQSSLLRFSPRFFCTSLIGLPTILIHLPVLYPDSLCLFFVKGVISLLNSQNFKLKAFFHFSFTTIFNQFSSILTFFLKCVFFPFLNLSSSNIVLFHHF